MRRTLLFLSVFIVAIKGLFIIEASAQTLTGRVCGQSDSLPLPGVYVRLQGNSSVGAVTDVNGRYSLRAIPVGKDPYIDVTLGTSVQVLGFSVGL